MSISCHFGGTALSPPCFHCWRLLTTKLGAMVYASFPNAMVFAFFESPLVCWPCPGAFPSVSVAENHSQCSPISWSRGSLLHLSCAADPLDLDVLTSTPLPLFLLCSSDTQGFSEGLSKEAGKGVPIFLGFPKSISLSGHGWSEFSLQNLYWSHSL